MPHLLVIYSAKTPTVDLVMELIIPFSHANCIDIKEKDSGQVTAADIYWSDCILMIRPYDKTCSDIMKVSRQYNRFVIVYLDDDLLHVPNLYASLPRKLIAVTLKRRNQKALRACLSQCNVLWGSNPLLLDRYKALVKSGRCIKCDVVTNISNMKPVKKHFTGTRLLFAGAVDHYALLNKYIVPALNQLTATYSDLQMTCIGITENQLQHCKFKVKCIPWTNDYMQYRKNIEKEDCDIGIAVIEEDEFYQCKYFNKFIEYSLMGMVGIYTNISPYTLIARHRVNGFLTNSSVESWRDTIEYAINHPDLCKNCAVNAQTLIKEKFDKEKLIKELSSLIPELSHYNSNKTKKVIYRTKILWNLCRKLGNFLIESYETHVANTGGKNE